jgi:large subunit ribosomal protein L25
MSNQIELAVAPRAHTGKGAAGRARREGLVPGVLYGYETEPAAVSVNALELYHALHTAAGTNVLLRVDFDGEEHLCVARDIQRHAVRGDVQHLDLLAVDKNATIVVDVPVHLIDEPADLEGVVNQILTTVPINVPPLLTPNSIELSIAGMTIGDVKRVEDLRGTLPEGANFDIDPDRTIVTVNPPDILEEPEEESDLLGLEGEDPGEDAPAAEGEGDAPAGDDA